MNAGTTAAAGLATPGARAVLVGTGRHVSGSELPGLPSVDTTLDDLQRALRDVCGMPDDAIHRVPADAGPPDVVAAVEQAVADASGVVLFYYVGHGLLGPGDELYLATYGTESADRVSHAVPYRTVKDLLSEASGDGVVILDCCFSGRAAVPVSGRSREPFASARPGGSVLLSSASHFALSFAPEGERRTLFSGRLLQLLERGDPAGSQWLTVDQVYALLDREFEGSPVRPHRQSEGRLGELVIARNRGYRPAPGPDHLPPADIPCPYPGLGPFRAEDSRHFFGREEITTRLLDAVSGSVGGPPGRLPVIVVGASGVGKSSLLRAGLLAALEQRHEAAGSGGRPDRVPWPALLLPAPGPQPLRSLAELWAQATGRRTDEVLTAFTEGDGFPEPLPGHIPCRLLVVDQFEEVFTRCRDSEQRTAFIRLLTGEAQGAQGAPSEAPRVVLGLRADHYGSCLAHPPLVRALAQGQFTVSPMDEDALRAAVERPAEAVGLTLEPGLTDRLLHDLQHGGARAPAAGPDDTAALPFLAHALRETWRTRSGAVLTLAGYQRTGGIWQSVTKTTTELYQSLDESGRRVLRDLLLRMIHLAADGTGPVVRRRVRLTELLDGASPQRRRLITEIRDRLANARLITMDQRTAQISHEALLRAWPQLRRWIDEDRSDLLSRQQLAEAADAWQAAGRDPSFLLRGTRLDAAEDLGRRATLRRQPLRRRDLQFLGASGAEVRAERLREARRTRRLKQALGGVAVALCMALIAAGAAFQQQRTAQDQRRLATYRALTAEAGNLRQSDPQTSLRLGLAAYRIRPTTEARKAVFDTLAQTPFGGMASLSDQGTREGSQEVAGISSDGRLVATTDGQNRITVWDVRNAARPALTTTLQPCRDYVRGLTFSHDARLLATACQDGSVSLWSLSDQGDLRRLATLRLPSLPGAAEAVAFSPDGRTLAAAGWWNEDTLDGSLGLWSLRDPAHPRQLTVLGRVYDNSALVFSPDGRTLVSSTGRVMAREEPVDKDSIVRRSGATFWDVTDPVRPRRLSRQDVLGETMAFSPDGRLFAVGRDRTVLLWDLSAPAGSRLPVTWTAQTDLVSALAFGPDGRRLVTGGFDDDVNLWNLDDPGRPRRLRTFSGNAGTIEALAFAPDGHAVVSATDESVIRWYVAARGRPAVAATLAPGGSLNAAAITPDGRTLATGGIEETIALWDLTHPARRLRTATLTGHTKFVRALAISPDGRNLASGGDDGRIMLWDITDRSNPRRVAVLAGPGDMVFSVDFSPDGSTLVATGGATFFPPAWAQLWNVTRPSRPRDLGRFSGVGALGRAQFSPDGRLLALPGESRTLLWDRDRRGMPVALPEGDSESAFAPDGRTLATSDGSDHAVLLWDVSDSAHPHQVGAVPADDHRTDIHRLAFHPGGNLLAAAGDDGRITLWDVGDRSLPHLAAALTGHRDSVTDLAFSPDGHRLITASSDTSVLVWDLGDLPAISADPIRTACRIAGGGLTRGQWDAYATGLGFQRTCP
ncbi:caspase family protein [Streptomyces sp. ME02-6991-2B]|nr:caspase family protein [Streptomyces sp. ME02-6991-2B]